MENLYLPKREGKGKGKELFDYIKFVPSSLLSELSEAKLQNYFRYCM